MDMASSYLQSFWFACLACLILVAALSFVRRSAEKREREASRAAARELIARHFTESELLAFTERVRAMGITIGNIKEKGGAN